MRNFRIQDLEILFEDNHMIVVNKPCGILVQGDQTGDKPLSEIVKSYLKEKYNKPGNVYLGVVHRLDRPTSGAMVFAKTSKALSRLNEQFKQKITQKTYWAIVSPKPQNNENELVHFLVRNSKQNKSYAHANEVPNSKRGILSYRLLKSFNAYHLLEIKLETGRHHQIRAQLSKIGSIIKGDLKYGAKRSNTNGGIHLHARKLVIQHPTKKEEISFVAKAPKDRLWDLCL